MESKYSFKNLDIVNTLFLTLTPVAAIVATYYWVTVDGFSWAQVLLGIAFYILSGFSITAGYHRLFAHKAYDAHPVVKFFFLIFGAAAFQNSALKWCSDHRVHHLKVDTNEDPYNINEGFFHAHMGWVFLKKNGIVNEKFAKDFRQDPLVLWQHKYYLLIAVTVGMVVPFLIGGFFFGSFLGGLAMGVLARIVFIHHCTFFINSLCHYIGTTPYTDTNTAKDSWFMALLTFGEGYHNFHHYYQYDYRNGIRWYQFDPTKWLIKSLNLTGLAYKLRKTSPDKILESRMMMKMKLAAKNQSQDLSAEFEKLKTHALEMWKRFQEAKAEYKRTKSKEIKHRMELARLEFQASMKRWELLVMQGQPIPY